MSAINDVYEFLYEQNRPHSADDVARNVSKEHSKSAIQKALDKLIGQKKIFDRVYGKQRIYCVSQVADSDDAFDKMRAIDRKIAKVSTELLMTKAQLRQTKTELAFIKKKMTTHLAKTETSSLTDEIANLRTRLAELNEFCSRVGPISEEERKQILAEREKYAKEYKKRKRICVDMIDSIMEGYPDTKKQLIQDIGIESDEEVGFTTTY